jgi:lysine N6-hydroxylase
VHSRVAERYDGSLHAIGIGLGPANLSVAALADQIPGLRAIFLERRPEVAWHPGLLFEHAEIQTSFVKDLVSLVDPTSRHSFLNFLVETGRIYRFLVVSHDGVSRREYDQYYRWVAGRLASVRCSSEVTAVSYDPTRGFIVSSDDGIHVGRHLVIATGRRAHLPEFARHLCGARVLHASEFLDRQLPTNGRRVLIVGGGQSGAEVVLHLLSEAGSLPSELIWASRRFSFLPLDDSPFVNEWFTPRYVEYFGTLARERRTALIDGQRLASHGISEALLRRIYSKLYQIDFVSSREMRHRLLPGYELQALSPDGDRSCALLHNEDNGNVEHTLADIVVFATGYLAELPDCMAPLRAALPARWVHAIQADYSLAWDGADTHRIYVQNASDELHGIADANLSLLSWRAATILNSLCDREVFSTDRGSTTITWESTPAASARVPVEG